MNKSLKLSKTAIRELTRRYRAVLMAVFAASAFVTTGATAADTLVLYFDSNDTNQAVYFKQVEGSAPGSYYTMPLPSYVTNNAATGTYNSATTYGVNTIGAQIKTNTGAISALTDGTGKINVDKATIGDDGIYLTNGKTGDELAQVILKTDDNGIFHVQDKTGADAFTVGQDGAITAEGKANLNAGADVEGNANIGGYTSGDPATTTYALEVTARTGEGDSNAGQVTANEKFVANQGAQVVGNLLIGTGSTPRINLDSTDGSIQFGDDSKVKLTRQGSATDAYLDISSDAAMNALFLKASGTEQTAKIIALDDGTASIEGDARVAGDLFVGLADLTKISSSDSTYSINMKQSDNSYKQAFTVDADGDTTVLGTLQIGGASAITGSAATSGESPKPATLDMGGNALENILNLTADGTSKFGEYDTGKYALEVSSTDVKANQKITANAGISSTSYNVAGTTEGKNVIEVDTNGIRVKKDDSTNSTLFEVDANGNITQAGTVNATGLKTNVATGDKLMVTLGDSSHVSSTVEIDGGLKFKGDGNPVVTAIDTSATSFGTDDNTMLATLSSIKNLAENATFTVAGGTSNITGTPTINEAIDTLDGKMGQVSTVNVKGYEADASKRTLTGAVNALETNMKSIFGGLYVAPTSTSASAYDGSVLGDMYKSAGTSPAAGATLQASLTNLASNITAITGGTMSSGKVANDYMTDVTVVKYAVLENDSTTPLASAIGQINKNIGTDSWKDSSDVTHGLHTIIDRDEGVSNNGVASANTINQNIVALNETIGDLTGLNAYDSTDTASKGNALARRDSYGAAIATPSTVVEALNNIDETLGTIHGLNTKRGADAKGNLATGTTVEDHLVSLDDAIGNRNYSSTNYVTAGSDLATAVGALDSNLGRLDRQVSDLYNRSNKMHHEMKSGFASLAAMSALVPDARSAGDTQISVGTGYYRGTTGFALGAFHHVSDNVLLNAGAAYAGNGAATFRGGVTFGF